MDQLRTTEAELYERAFPSKDLAYWLGQVLNYPTSDIPTREDYEREQGLIGVPTPEQSSRQSGQDALDYLTMAHGIASLLKSGTGAAQELMGKRRGQETFGKEMMDTSRRAQPQKWREMREEDLAPVERPMRSGYGSSLPPGETPTWRAYEMKPADVVEKGTWKSRLGDVPAYMMGAPVELPGGQQAQYLVIQSGAGASVVLDAGTQRSVVFTTQSMGEALAKARQLQNRLALAAQDLGRYNPQDAITGRLMYSAGPAAQGPRRVRLPWERGTSFGEGPDWPRDYSQPPGSGRWSK